MWALPITVVPASSLHTHVSCPEGTGILGSSKHMPWLWCSRPVVSGKKADVIPPDKPRASPCSKEVELLAPAAQEQLFLCKV